MLPRRLRRLLLKKLEEAPAVALLGARQAGKTTLAKSLSPLYYDCEQAGDRLRIDLEWEKIRKGRQVVVFDEAQTWPELFARLRGAIDEDRRRHGRFLLLGSVSPGILREVSEALTGRLALCELTPFLAVELPPKRSDDLWLMGGYPGGGAMDQTSFPDWQRDYLALLAERDLPNWGLSAKPRVTERLFQMLAVLNGTPWNASQVGKGLGLSYHTVNSYLDYLESAFLIRRLPAFHGNLKKRIIKSPKIYWRDSGLLHSLLGVVDFRGLMAQPWVGFSWEGWVIGQVLDCLKSGGMTFEAFYLQTGAEGEIDLILDYAGKRWAFEIKLTSEPDEADMKKLHRLADLVAADRRVLLSRKPETMENRSTLVTNLHDLLKRLEVSRK